MKRSLFMLFAFGIFLTFAGCTEDTPTKPSSTESGTLHIPVSNLPEEGIAINAIPWGNVHAFDPVAETEIIVNSDTILSNDFRQITWMYPVSEHELNVYFLGTQNALKLFAHPDEAIQFENWNSSPFHVIAYVIMAGNMSGAPIVEERIELYFSPPISEDWVLIECCESSAHIVNAEKLTLPVEGGKIIFERYDGVIAEVNVITD